MGYIRNFLCLIALKIEILSIIVFASHYSFSAYDRIVKIALWFVLFGVGILTAYMCLTHLIKKKKIKKKNKELNKNGYV